MNPGLEMIYGMMPYAARITLDGQAPTRSTDEADRMAVFTVQVAARMAEEALRLAQPPEPARDDLHAAIADLLGPRLSTPEQRKALLRGLGMMASRGLVGVT